MRVTNQMVSANTMLYLNNTQGSLLNLQQQLTTGKKIGKPSDDPIIAVRSLKLKTDISQIGQYKRNVDDAISWLNVTEKSLSNMTDIYKKMRQLSVQGSSGTYVHEDQMKILEEIKQLSKQLKSEGNTTYAGRSIFTGYRTSQSLIHKKGEASKKVDITQKFTVSDLKQKKIVESGKYVAGAIKAPELKTAYRIRLGYKDIDALEAGKLNITSSTLTTPTIQFVNQDEANAYEPAAGKINVIKETGEIIFNSEDAKEIIKSDPNFKVEVTYTKDGFKEGEQVAEHYYDTDVYQATSGLKVTDGKVKLSGVPVKEDSLKDLVVATSPTATTINPADIVYTDSGDATTYPGKVRVDKDTGELTFGTGLSIPDGVTVSTKYKTELKADNQKLNYEISINQQVAVNSEGKNVLTTEAIRDMDEMVNRVKANVDKIKDLEREIEIVKKDDSLSATDKEDKVKFYESQIGVYKDVISDHYNRLIGESDKALGKISEESAVIGSKTNRMELTKTRLDDNKLNFTELLSKTEDIDLTEKLIELKSQQVVYNAALMSSSKMVQPTLLEYLR